jgi:uncharacterized repeat protein (TIGR01451 family)
MDLSHAMDCKEREFERPQGSFVRRAISFLGSTTLAVAILAAPAAHADVDTFQEGTAGYSGTLDTYLDSAFPSTAQGALSNLSVDNSPPNDGLIRFDNIFGPGADQIPFGAIINSATLTVWVSNASDSTAQIRVHRMLVPWDESSTWNSMTAGIQTNDVEAASAFDGQVAAPQELGIETITGLGPTVQAWSSGATNLGWVMISNSDTGWEFPTSESGTVTERPMLTVDWTPTYVISGSVFEDTDFAGTASDYDGGTNDLALANVDVELYDNTDTYLSSTTTDASGNFSFRVIDGTYKGRVRSATIGDSNTAPDGGFNAAWGITDPASGTACAVAEQTWGNGAAAIGGQSATADDTATNDNAGPGDTWVNVTVSGVDVSNVNFGFAYNAIVNTSNSGQGSLRQFIDNANAIGSANGTTANYSEFLVPNVALTAGVAIISPTTALPALTDAGTTIDGTTQTDNVGNTNAAVLGTGGTVGVDGLALSQVNGPEVEIRDAGGLAIGLDVQGSNTAIRGLAILGFGASEGQGAIVIADTFTNTLVEENLIGSTATSFTDPGAALRNYGGVESVGGDSGTIQNNLIGFGHRGVFLNGGSNSWTVENNEIVDNDLASADGDGIAVDGSSNNTIRGNLITGSSSQGLVVTAATDIDFVNNTVTGNGVGSTTTVAQSAGVTLRPTAQRVTIDRNVINANYGAGIAVNNNNATDSVFTRNSIYDNGSIVARNGSPATGQIGIDLNGAGEDSNLGTSPFYNVNDSTDTDSGGNDLLNFPVLDTVTTVSGNITFAGWSQPGATIEIYLASVDPFDQPGFGEGRTWIGTFVEGVADSDAATSTYGPGAINGVAQGTDTTNRFSFTVPLSSLPVTVNNGDQLVATSTVGTAPTRETSEFSALAPVAAAQADLTLTMTANPDPGPLGGSLLYVLAVTNAGPQAATGVTVTDTLPASVTLASATPTQGTCSGTTTVTCDLGTMFNGGTASIEILVVPNSTGTITNDASVSSAEVDPAPADNSVSIDTDIVEDTDIDMPLTQYARMHGFFDYTVTGGSLRTGDTSQTRCDIAATSSGNLAGIPATATVHAAYLYWAGSGDTADNVVTFDGVSVTADRTFAASNALGSNVYEFFGGFEDVTAQVAAKGNGLYTFTDLTINNGSPWCSGQAVLGGWILYVVYEDLSLSGKTLVLYDGFDLERNGTLDYLLTGIYAAGPVEAKTTAQVWEGDIGLGGSGEVLEFNAAGLSDAVNPATNVYNSTINSLGVTTSYGVDLDTFDVSSGVSIGDTAATTRVSTGSDRVLLNSVMLQVKSNIIVGTVFEDVNYGGGAGRDLATAVADAPAFTVPRPGAVVELYDAAGNFLRTTVTDADGDYGFAGLIDGSYAVRVVNDTVTSSRPGATGTEWPVQTFRTDATGASIVAVTNEVGGADPTAQDDPANVGGLNLSAITAQSLASVAITAAEAKTDVDFGFNFDTIVNTNDSGQGSLREFIDNSNTLGNANLAQDGLTAGIEHSIFMLADGTARPGLKAGYPSQFTGGVATFTPNPAYPTVTDPIALDASLQPGYAGSPIIEIDGSAAAANLAGFHISAGGSTVRGFVIHGFRGADPLGAGIQLDTAGGNTITANWLGTDTTGAAAGAAVASNNTQGLLILNSAGNQVGGTDPADRNVMSGNRLRGMHLEGTSASGNTIEGNYFGTSADGTAAVPNPMGIYFREAPDNTFGGTANGAGNVVSGNSIHGVYLVGDDSDRNIVKGNTIGLNAAQTGALGNGGAGIATFEADDAEIGGTENGAANVISANSTGIGLHTGSTGTLIRRNAIYDNTGLGIDHGFNSAVDPNDGAVGAGSNNGLDYPVITSALLGSGTLSVTGYVGSAPGQAAFANVEIDVLVADNDPADQDGEVILGDGLSEPHGEAQTFIDSCTTAADGTFDCDLTVPGTVTLISGDFITALAYDAAGNTSEFGVDVAVSADADLVITTVLDPSTPGPFAEGDSVTYLVTVTNNGPLDATNVTATDTYPSELTLGTATPSAPTTYNSASGLWTIGSLASGASATLTLAGTINADTAGDVVTNSVTAATGDQNDPTTAGDDLDEVFTVMPFLSIDDVTQAETDSGETTFTFTVTINQAVGYDITGDVATADGTATTADGDYPGGAGSGPLPAGETTVTIDVTVNGDTRIESDETFFVNLSNVVGAVVIDGQGQGTITNDDSAEVSVAATTDGNESGPVDGRFTVTQSVASGPLPAVRTTPL